jgi:hypothetical protein
MAPLTGAAKRAKVKRRLSTSEEPTVHLDQQQVLILYAKQPTQTNEISETSALHQAKLHLINWHRRARQVQLSCYSAAKWFDFWHFVIGAPLILLTAFGATSFYKSLEASHHRSVIITTEVIGLLLPILAALQTFLGYGQRAEKFRTTAAKYGSIRREMEQGSALSLNTEQDADKFMGELRTELDTLAREAPEAPGIVWWWTRQTTKDDHGSPLFPTDNTAANASQVTNASSGDSQRN